MLMCVETMTPLNAPSLGLQLSNMYEYIDRERKSVCLARKSKWVCHFIINYITIDSSLEQQILQVDVSGLPGLDK